ncbi:MAG: DUF3365 domain-containing protein [Deltaproteobacteria bacterium]|jgi:two-component system, cell cycle sensor histidine kinase and response regulator CckA|nr:DUF3365 domain-containing protein [Deltaproteobacteria bacterium]
MIKKSIKITIRTKLVDYALALAIVWTIVIILFTAWNVYQKRQSTRALATQEARAIFNKDQAIRLWATTHGGVYVPINERTQANPHLKQVPERDIITYSGRKLTLMNPAYMLRQMMDEYSELYGVKGRITSLKPLRVQNTPDDWERSALKAFENGVKEEFAFVDINGKPYLRLIQPMITKKGCLKCHGSQGYKVGDVRGGVGVSVPMSSFLLQEESEIRRLIISYILIWLFGVGIIYSGFRRLRRSIAERDQAVLAQYEKEERFRCIVEETEAGYFFIDKEGIFQKVNKAWLEMHHYSLSEEVIGQHFSLTQTDSDLESANKIVKGLLDGKSLPVGELSRRCKDGSIGYHSFTVNPVVQNKKITGLEGFIIDTSNRKQAEKELENAKKQWETTFDAMSDWVCIINKDHEIIRSNKACESIINLSVDQVVGRLCHEIVHGMDLSILDCPLQKAINSNRLESMELKTGDNRWLQITVDPIEIGTNNDWFVHIVRDITEAKERENEIIIVQKAKAFSILSGGIAHDYNNLLTTIWGNISLLKEEMTRPQQQELLNDADNACIQARDLTRQFITLSRVALPKKTSYNIEDILRSAIEKADEAKDIEISMDIKDKIPAIEIDPEGLSLAFENIICNAVEAMPDGGRLEILVKTEIVTGKKDEKDESLITISFKDSGVGISIHDIDSVFDPYFTTKELSTQKGGGLGLAVSQSIVKKHGGKVRINSKLGQGTTITVTLPITN